MKEIKNLERKKFKAIRDKSSLLEREKVKQNVELFIQSYEENKELRGYIAIYWPLKNEVDLTPLKRKYPLALPRCKDDRKLEFLIWDEKPLKNDCKGIPSPDNESLLTFEEISVILVPCLSVDRKFTRLGYGGGYFDKLRSKMSWRCIPCIGILTSKCISKDNLSKEEWDIPLSGYITDKETLVYL